jgi:hypothetical protein
MLNSFGASGDRCFRNGADVTQAEIDNQRSQAFQPPGWIADLCVKGEPSDGQAIQKTRQGKACGKKAI